MQWAMGCPYSNLIIDLSDWWKCFETNIGQFAKLKWFANYLQICSLGANCMQLQKSLCLLEVWNLMSIKRFLNKTELMFLSKQVKILPSWDQDQPGSFTSSFLACWKAGWSVAKDFNFNLLSGKSEKFQQKGKEWKKQRRK